MASRALHTISGWALTGYVAGAASSYGLAKVDYPLEPTSGTFCLAMVEEGSRWGLCLGVGLGCFVIFCRFLESRNKLKGRSFVQVDFRSWVLSTDALKMAISDYRESRRACWRAAAEAAAGNITSSLERSLP